MTRTADTKTTTCKVEADRTGNTTLWECDCVECTALQHDLEADEQA